MEIKVSDGVFNAHVSRPAKLPAPAAVVLQEIFGVNADIRATCDELAAAGFIAIAPDLFWRDAPGLDLNSWSDARALQRSRVPEDDGGNEKIETGDTVLLMPPERRTFRD